MMRWSVVWLKDKRIACNMFDWWQHLLREYNIAVILAVDFHSRDDKDQLSHTHFRHSNGNYNGYLQFEAKFMIFRILKFPKVRCIQ